MSNRHGKTAHSSQKWKEGKLCPICFIGHLKACPCENCNGHKKYNLECTKCRASNY